MGALPFSEFEKQLAALKQFNNTSQPFQRAIDALLNSTSVGVAAQVINIAAPTSSVTNGIAAAVVKQLFFFGAGSKREQEGVHPILLQVANRAIEIVTVDMVFYDGVRTYKEQAANLAAGTTRTMNSKHLIQKDGYSHAMDLVPYINGRPTWDWDGCYRIALAVDQAATELGVAHRIRWGGAWDRTLADFGGSAEAYKAEVQAYQKRHAGKDFIDGPHFELVS